MSFIRAKEIPPRSGNWYNYEVENHREGSKVVQKVIRYIGKSGKLGTTSGSGQTSRSSSGPQRPVEKQTVIHSDTGDITVLKLAKKIERAKTNTQKDDLFISVYGDDRMALLKHIILSMPKGTYLLKREGFASPSLERAIINKYGVAAGLSNLEQTLRGLSIAYPDKISVNFTLGLDAIEIKANKRRKSKQVLGTTP